MQLKMKHTIIYISSSKSEWQLYVVKDLMKNWEHCHPCMEWSHLNKLFYSFNYKNINMPFSFGTKIHCLPLVWQINSSNRLVLNSKSPKDHTIIFVCFKKSEREWKLLIIFRYHNKKMRIWCLLHIMVGPRNMIWSIRRSTQCSTTNHLSTGFHPSWCWPWGSK